VAEKGERPPPTVIPAVGDIVGAGSLARVFDHTSLGGLKTVFTEVKGCGSNPLTFREELLVERIRKCRGGWAKTQEGSKVHRNEK